MKSIAVIPARSGSKGLKDKNIKLLNGKPLIWYSIQSAITSGCFDEVMVSTDSEKYAKIARACGASVPFLRSEAMSTDKASSWETVQEVLDNYKGLGKSFDAVMLLQPTSPLRTADDIKKAFAILEDKKADSVVGVCEMDHSPLWSNVLPENGCLDGFIRPEVKESSGRQSLPTYYRINGAIYLTKVTNKLGADLYSDSGYAYVMAQAKSIDIDTELDFRMAEFLLKTQG
jgi:CMP-N,N'-diacetyllegionaminic acid synthase